MSIGRKITIFFTFITPFKKHKIVSLKIFMEIFLTLIDDLFLLISETKKTFVNVLI